MLIKRLRMAQRAIKCVRTLDNTASRIVCDCSMWSKEHALQSTTHTAVSPIPGQATCCPLYKPFSAWQRSAPSELWKTLIETETVVSWTLVFKTRACQIGGTSDIFTEQEKAYLKARFSPFPGKMLFNPQTIATRCSFSLHAHFSNSLTDEATVSMFCCHKVLPLNGVANHCNQSRGGYSL